MGMNDSTVSLELDGETVDLVATLEAAQVMSRTYGGLMNLHKNVREMDLDAICVAIRAGLMVDGDEAKAIPEKVFRTGIVNVVGDVSEFVLLVASGGMRPKDDEDVGESEKPGKP